MKRENYFRNLVTKPDEQINLAEAALHIASDQYPDLKIDSYLALLAGWGKEVSKKCARRIARKRLDQINEFLFSDLKFSGNIENYYDPKNSFLNEVIDRRCGIPITLSVIYLEMAWRSQLNAAGVSFPGHFLVRVLIDQDLLYIDPFHQGNIMDASECREFWEDISGDEMEFQEAFLSPTSRKQIVVRMLRNLKRIYLESKDYERLLPVLEKLIALNPDSADEIRDRGIVYYHMEAFKLAMQDFETFLSVTPEGEDAEVIQQYLEVLREYSSHLN
jgi:regulator of sirC expression with transglutaminase-like and TPR domain